MYKISDLTELECETLKLDKNLFKNANTNGKDRYHVKNECGQDFDIYYVDNDEGVPDYVKTNMNGYYLFPDYKEYDTSDKDKLYLDIFNQFDQIVFTTVDEYSVALTKVILENTTLDVIFTDERIFYFLEKSALLHVDESIIPMLNKARTMYVGSELNISIINNDFSSINSVTLFHNVFFWQWISKPNTKIKYVKLALYDPLGIGGIIEKLALFSNLMAQKGYEILFDDSGTRYSCDLIQKYFNFKLIVDDSTSENTFELKSSYAFFILYYAMNYGKQYYSDKVLNPTFLNNLKEYKNMVFGNNKMLGVLIRGTDYLKSDYHMATRKMVGPNEMITIIEEWMNKYSFDKIFLATEDKDILEQMRSHFSSKVITISQERYSVKDFNKNETIAEKEKTISDSNTYSNILEDATSNYFYALYLLSECDSLICSGQCNGWDVVINLNDGKFTRKYKFKGYC